MKRWTILALLLAFDGLMVACSSDRQLDREDSGIQSKDVVAATEKLAADLIAFRSASPDPYQWTVVVDRVEDRTLDRLSPVNYDIFLERLRSLVSEKGYGRIAIIENQRAFDEIRGREAKGTRDEPAPGVLTRQVPATAYQPNFALHGKAFDLPGHKSNYYLLQFDLVNLNTREQPWSRTYEVKVAR